MNNKYLHHFYTTVEGTLPLVIQLNLPDEVSQATQAQMKRDHPIPTSSSRRRLQWHEFIPKDQHAKFHSNELSQATLDIMYHRKLKSLHDQGVVTDGQDVLTVEDDPAKCIYTLERASRVETRFLSMDEVEQYLGQGGTIQSTSSCVVGKSHSWQGTD